MNAIPSQVLATLRWATVLTPLAVVIGSASAFFLWALDEVTRIRFSNPGLMFLLPIAGLLIGVIYHVYGKSASEGTNRIIDEIHQPGVGVPRRMAPLILLCTLITHLCGGSAGREGTALQMGGGIAATFARLFKLEPDHIRIVIMAGVAAGFGSIFGTPIAGAVFALEVLVVGRVRYDALIPCFFASVVADFTCHAWGIGHTSYQVFPVTPEGAEKAWLIGKVVIAAIAFGLASKLFSTLSHRLADLFASLIPRAELRPVAGGFLVIGLFLMIGTGDYLGLGVLGNRPDAVTLPAMFTSAEIPAFAWGWKLIFTAITLSAGFKGGEVTPLFFIGAALGNTLAIFLDAPIDLFAALGFVAIFAGATKTPIASTILGMELFGSGHGLYLATACIIAFHCSGNRGIYSSQRSSS